MMARKNPTTGRVTAPRPLSQSEREFRALLDAAVDAIIVIDHSGTIEEFNFSAQRMFGYTAEESSSQRARPDARAVSQRARRLPAALPVDWRAANHRHRA